MKGASLLALGIGLGAGLGAAFGDLAVGIGVGTANGAGLYGASLRKGEPPEEKLSSGSTPENR